MKTRVNDDQLISSESNAHRSLLETTIWHGTLRVDSSSPIRSFCWEGEGGDGYIEDLGLYWPVDLHQPSARSQVRQRCQLVPRQFAKKDSSSNNFWLLTNRTHGVKADNLSVQQWLVQLTEFAAWADCDRT